MPDSRLVYGFHSVTAILRSNPESIVEIYLDNTRCDGRSRDLARLAAAQNTRLLSVDGKRLDGLAGGRRHQGIIARVIPSKRQLFIDDVLDTLEEPPLLLVLDGVKDPHNLGACLRVADAVGAHAVIAPKDRACGLTQTAIKVASGAAEAIPYITVTNLARTLRDLKARDIMLIGTADEAGASLYQAQWQQGAAWILGAEGEGLRRLTRETCDQLISIPMLGSVSSLNVSVAAGICLYEARRRRDFIAK